ncbi:glycosyltransferase family 2 protein [Hafnia alvei]|uniref:glycosyltransferase family 2 protein n=1 Tax=Hafnia alvei TaxID=569 RepID=UPI001D10ECB0|nr:glycosyltransferase family 2 protein [Hafnia alvei]
MNNKLNNKKNTSSNLMNHLLQRQGSQRVEGEKPFVSVVCPSYNRREFLPYLLYIYQYQDYPADRRELIIVDDSRHSSQDLVDMLVDPSMENVRYIHSDRRLMLGEKRNMLNDLAKGEYIVCFDDDDYYSPQKISYQVDELQRNNALFSGSDQIYVWYSHLNKIYRTHPFGPKHALNGTFAYHKKFLRKHRYEHDAMLAEEQGFLNNFSAPVLQIDPKRAILCVSHSANTYDKDYIMSSCEPVDLTLEDFVQDTNLLAHYRRLSLTPSTQPVYWECFEKVAVLFDPASEADLSDRCQALVAFGIPSERLVCLPKQIELTREISELTTHCHVLEQAQQQGWRNVLILDADIQFVKKENTVTNVNGLLKALPNIEWNVVLLGAKHFEMHLMESLPSVGRVYDALCGCAYAVNSSYFNILLTHYRECLTSLQAGAEPKAARMDMRWKELMQQHCWLAFHPSFAYLNRDWDYLQDKEIDCTHWFFRKPK